MNQELLVSKEYADRMVKSMRNDQPDDISNRMIEMANDFKNVQLSAYRSSRENQDA